MVNGGGGGGGGGGPDVRGLLTALYEAAAVDAASIEQGWPPQEMIRATPRLSAVFTWDQRDQARLLNAGLLRVLRRLLDPPVRLPGGSGARRPRPGQFTPAHTKAAILKLLQVLPVGLVHLQEAKLGPVLLAAYTGGLLGLGVWVCGLVLGFGWGGGFDLDLPTRVCMYIYTDVDFDLRVVCIQQTITITGGGPEDEALARMLVSNWARFVDTVQVCRARILFLGAGEHFMNIRTHMFECT